MTTLEFIYFICDEFEEPCEDGIEFAKNNPNLLEAIDKLLIDTTNVQFIRWACWQEKIIGWSMFNKMARETDYSKTNQKCAEILKKFIADNNLV